MAASSAPASAPGPEELEAEYGFSRAKALFDLAEEAKHICSTSPDVNGIEIDYRPGQLSVAHKKRYLPANTRRMPRSWLTRFGYPHISFMDAAETAERLGSTHYFGGVRDTGTGHIHPLKLVVGTARVAAAAGAQLYEKTPATRIDTQGGKVRVTTRDGTITAAKCLLAIDAYGGDLEPVTASHIMPIGSFIGATVPLGRRQSRCCPAAKSVDDSRFVVRYFRQVEGQPSCCSAGAKSTASRTPRTSTSISAGRSPRSIRR